MEHAGPCRGRVTVEPPLHAALVDHAGVEDGRVATKRRRMSYFGPEVRRGYSDP